MVAKGLKVVFSVCCKARVCVGDWVFCTSMQPVNKTPAIGSAKDTQVVARHDVVRKKVGRCVQRVFIEQNLAKQFKIKEKLSKKLTINRRSMNFLC